jgi:hypothetical protein
VVAPQALMLLNSPEGIRYAESLADRAFLETNRDVSKNADREQSLIVRLFQLTLNRHPTDDEENLAIEHLHNEVAKLSENDEEARLRSAFVSLCRAMLNLNEFVYVD